MALHFNIIFLLILCEFHVCIYFYHIHPHSSYYPFNFITLSQFHVLFF